MDRYSFLPVFLTSSFACLVTILGIFVIGKYERWGRANAAYFMSFAAGVLVSVSFIHIVPKSFTMNDFSPFYLLVGFVFLHLINRYIKTVVCHEYDRVDYALGVVPMLGIGFHSFLDGIIYSVTFKVSIFTGLLAAIGMVLHEFPEGIVTFLLLERAGFSRKKSTIYAILAAAISTPLGTLLSYPFINKFDSSPLGILLALSAGALVYVGAAHLLPAVEKENKRYTLGPLFLGILVAVIIVLSKG